MTDNLTAYQQALSFRLAEGIILYRVKNFEAFVSLFEEVYSQYLEEGLPPLPSYREELRKVWVQLKRMTRVDETLVPIGRPILPQEVLAFCVSYREGKDCFSFPLCKTYREGISIEGLIREVLLETYKILSGGRLKRIAVSFTLGTTTPSSSLRNKVFHFETTTEEIKESLIVVDGEHMIGDWKFELDEGALWSH